VVKDYAGNSATHTSPPASIDRTAPFFQYAGVSPNPNSAGWFRSNPTLTWRCDDGLTPGYHQAMSHAPLSRHRVVVSNLTDPSDDRQYWWQQTPDARLAALETMRQVVYGYDPVAGRLQRFLELAQRAPR
jgi:hypothetical protein